MSDFQQASQHALGLLVEGAKKKQKPKQSVLTTASLPSVIVTPKVIPSIQQQQSQQQQQQKASTIMIEEVAGNFSKFAHQKQIKIKQRKQIIQTVINQALLSHFQAVKKQTQNQRKIIDAHEQNKKKIQEMIKLLIGSDRIINIQQFIKQPLVQIAKHQIIQKGGLERIKNVLTLLTILQRFSLIEGKILETKRLLASQYVKYQNNFIIPTTFNKEIFVKFNDSTSREGNYIFMHNGNLVQRQILMRLSPNERKSIMQMVMLYLKSINILADQNQIGSKILKILADVK